MKKKNKNALILVIGVVAAAFILFAGILAYRSLSQKPGSEDGQKTDQSDSQTVTSELNTAVQDEAPLNSADPGTAGDPVMQEISEPEEASDAAADTSVPENTEAETGSEEDPEKIEHPDYGRMLFIGDSRTIDMFADSDTNIYAELHDGIPVYGGHGCGLDFMKESIEDYGLDNFDTLVTWMGANEDGDFYGYDKYYEKMMDHGKTLVLFTVGPTDDLYLHYDADGYRYTNDKMESFNNELMRWAENRDVKVIDMYGYVLQSENVKIDPADGIHYLPRPTTELWDFILKNIN